MIRRIFPAIALALATCGGPPAFAQAVTSGCGAPGFPACQSATQVDLSGVIADILSIGSALLLPVLANLALNARAFLIKKGALTVAQANAVSTDSFNSALQKAITFGVTAMQGLIASQGWDHPEVRNAALATALTHLVAAFPDAINQVGVDVATQGGQARLVNALARAYPTAVAAVAASPATPDAGITVAALAASAAAPVTVTVANGVAPVPALVPASSIGAPAV